jgi:hypothetical protein
MRELNAIMEFDHVIEVHGDQTITEPRDVYAPDLWGEELPPSAIDDGWRLESGWTGQHGYRGPAMHPSEYIGGRLADHILATPGYWVALVCADEDGEAYGWAVAHRDA